MIVTLCKSFDLDAAHWLPLVTAEHKCHRMHGHTYRVELVCRGEVGANGMLVDYADVAESWSTVHAKLDHRVLNDVGGLENPTTEVLAAWIAERLRRELPLCAVRVYESATTWCEVEICGER